MLQPVCESTCVMEPECTSPNSRKPAIGPCLESVDSSPHTHIPFL